MTDITFEDKNQFITISINDEGLTAEDFIDRLVKPLMLALTYHPDTVNSVLSPCENCEYAKELRESDE